MAISFSSPLGAPIGLISNNLSKAANRRGESASRLASGLRVNKASDDIRAVSLSSKLQADTRVKNQARENINEANFALDVAQDAIKHATNILNRMGELASEAQDSSLTRSDRELLDTELQALNSELTRIEEEAEYNGRKLFKGGQIRKPGNEVTGFAVEGTVDLSADGKYAVYTRSSDNMVIREDLTTGDTVEIGIGENNSKVSIDASGERVAFSSTQDHTGENPLGRNNIFVYDFNTSSFTQVTNEGGNTNFKGFALSADGSTIAFNSSTNYTNGGGKADAGAYDGTPYFFIADVDNDTIYTSGDPSVDEIGAGGGFSLSSDGKQLAFFTDIDLLGDNADGNDEIFLVDFSDPLNATYSQVTDTKIAGIAYTPQVTTGGDVYFTTNEDFEGLNPDGASNVFKYDNASDSFSILTANTDTSNAFGGLTPNFDGSHVTFATEADLTGENSGNLFQVFRLNTETKELEQLTNYEANINGITNSSVIFSDDGSRAFARHNSVHLTAEITVTPGHSEIFEFNTGDGSATSISAVIDSLSGSLDGLGALTVSTTQGARRAEELVTSNITALGSIEGNINAARAELEAANNQVMFDVAENEDAASKLLEVDAADELASVLSNQLLEDTGVAMLSQAQANLDLTKSLLGLFENEDENALQRLNSTERFASDINVFQVKIEA